MQNRKKKAENTPKDEAQAICHLANEFKILRKYASQGFINKKDFSRIELEFKKQILKACGIDYLKPGEKILIEIN